MSRILRIREVARLLDVSMRTVHRYIDSGKLPGVKLPSGHWRVNEEDIAQLQHRDDEARLEERPPH